MSRLVRGGARHPAGEARAAAALLQWPGRDGPPRGVSGTAAEKLPEAGVTGWGKEEENKLYFFRPLSFTGCSVILVALRELPILIAHNLSLRMSLFLGTTG